MLRTIFVLILAAVGGVYAFGGAFNALLYYLWLAYFNPASWVWDDFILRLNLSLIAGIIVLLTVVISREKWRFDFRAALFLAIITQSLTSTLLSRHSDFAWPYFVDFSIMAIDVSRFRKTVMVIALSMGFEAAKQGWGSLILAPGKSNLNESWMLGDNNGVGVGMLMLTPMFIALAATATKKWERRFYQLMAIGVLYRGISTYSRGALLACVASALWYLFRSKQKVVAIVGISLASLLILPVLPTEFWQRMSTIGTAAENVEDADASIRGRLHFWIVALDMAADRPAFGIGHNAFTKAYDDYDSSNGEFGTARSVHSAWLGILAELGVPGLLIFITTVGCAFGACFRARAAVARGAPAELERFALAIEMALVAFCVGGAFVPFQYTEMLWHLFGLSAALAFMAKQYSAVAEQSVAGREPVVALASAVPVG